MLFTIHPVTHNKIEQKLERQFVLKQFKDV